MISWKFTVQTMLLASIVSTAGARAVEATHEDTRLVEAVKRGDGVAVATLLRDHVPVNSPEGDGSTALHWAAYGNNLVLAEELLNAKADPNAVTRIEALTPLYIACQTGSAPMIELLLKYGAKVNQANSLGTTPLMIAAASGSASAVEVLIAHGADVKQQETVHEQNALMFAANLNRSDAIRVLLAHGADPNVASKVTMIPKIQFRSLMPDAVDKDTSGRTGTKAVGHLHKSDAKQDAVATDAKTDAEAGSSEDEVANKAAAPSTAVAPAVADDAAKRPRRDYGAKSMGGMTPLLYAARQGNIASGEALLEGGAKINEVSGSEHTTPLVLAIANGHLDFAKMLVDHGADVNLANDQGVAPLYATIDVKWVPYEWSPEPLIDQEKTGYLDLMKILLTHGANPNARLEKQVWSRVLSENRNWIDPAGATAFWRAAQADDVEAMKLLKSNGADPNIPSKLGTTPMMVAAGLGWSANYSTTAPTRLEAIQYCMSLGQDINAQDDLGYTPLHGAAFVGDLQNIQFLVDHGAKTNVKTKAGDTVADMANGPFEKSLPIPAAVALLEKLGSANSNNCRSSDCVPPVKEDKKPVVAAASEPKPPAPKKPVD
jgi:ankyrin repeat protein